MKRLIKILSAAIIACIMAVTFAACGGSGDAIDNNPETPVTGDSKILVAYFSFSGNTQQLANMVAEETGGDLFRIVPETPYTNNDVFDRAQRELNDGTRPPLSEHIDEEVMAEYDVIFVGFPIWWYDLPRATLQDGEFVISVADLTDDFDAATGRFHNEVSEGVAKYTVATGWQKLGSIFSGYFTWIGNLMKGDLGKSFKYQRPVADVIRDNMWISFAIALIATILQFLIAIPLGITSATHQYTFRDYTVTVLTMIGISLPTYFFAAIVVKVFAVDLGWFPPSKLIDTSKTYNTATFVGFFMNLGDIIHHLVLPIFVNVILSLGGLMRYTRTNMLEVLSSDYIRTARAKGLSEKTVVYKHAFRNTLIPLATLLAGILPSLFGGMMITEKVFAIDGIGGLAYQALYEGDVPFVMGYNMFLAVLTVIGTLLSDIMYSIVDPRVKLGD